MAFVTGCGEPTEATAPELASAAPRVAPAAPAPVVEPAPAAAPVEDLFSSSVPDEGESALLRALERPPVEDLEVHLQGHPAPPPPPGVPPPPKPVVTPRLDGVPELPETVETTVKRYAGQLKYCYESRLKSYPGLSGRIEVEIALEEGRTTTATLITNSTGDEQLGQCVIAKIKRWSWPVDVTATYAFPFVFQPG